MDLVAELKEKYPELYQWLLKYPLPKDFRPNNHRDVATEAKANMTRNVCRKCQRLGECAVRCTACNVARYCDKECQDLDWDDHQAVCALNRITHEAVKKAITSGHLDE